MKDVRVIGIGSPFGNDNIGWQTINHLRQHLARAPLPEPVDLLDCDRPGVNLISLFAGAKCVVLVDAILAADQHGEVIQLDAEQLINTPAHISSHDLDAATAMTLAATLHCLPETLYIVGLGIDLARTTLLKPERIDILADKIMSLLNTYFQCHIPV